MKKKKYIYIYIYNIVKKIKIVFSIYKNFLEVFLKGMLINKIHTKIMLFIYHAPFVVVANLLYTSL